MLYNVIIAILYPILANTCILYPRSLDFAYRDTNRFQLKKDSRRTSFSLMAETPVSTSFEPEIAPLAPHYYNPALPV
jgi:hypothetical protein